MKEPYLILEVNSIQKVFNVCLQIISDFTLINSTTYLTRSKHTTQKKCPLLPSQFHRVHLPKPHLLYYSTDKPRSKKPSECNGEMTTAQKLKKAVTDYGTTVIVFHISISLASLGTCYFLVLKWVATSKRHLKCSYYTFLADWMW